MAIGYMIGIVLSNGSKSLYRDPRAQPDAERPGKVFQSPTEAMLALPDLKWRKCGDGPHDIDAYGKKGEIYYMVPINMALPNPMKLRRTPTKLTTGQR
jgi:hypothetical protein